MSVPGYEIVLEPGCGRAVEWAGNRVTFKAVGADTHGHVGVFECSQAPETVGARRHIHREMEEMFYVLEGQVEISVGERLVQAQPGAFVLVPRGVPHGFANRGTVQARLLIIFSPGGQREGYFEGLAEMIGNGSPADPGQLKALMARFDQEMVE